MNNTMKKNDVEDMIVLKLQNIDSLNSEEIAALKKRQLIAPVYLFQYLLLLCTHNY